MPSPDVVVSSLAFATLLGDIVALLLLFLTIAEVAGLLQRTILSSWLSRWGLVVMLLVALTVSSGSLFFSEGAGWTPCKDCWFQRIFMYPQVPLLALALVLRDRHIAPYILLLCLIGASFSVNQYVGQVRTILLPALAGTCGDPTTNCNVTQIFKLGYITIPMMALTAFTLNALVAWTMVRQGRKT